MNELAVDIPASAPLKARFTDLAIAGAVRHLPTRCMWARPNVGNQERLMRRIQEVIESRWFSNNGPRVQEFEREAARYLGVRHFIAMCNSTIALEIAIRAADSAGEVIVPSFTFVATAHSLQWQEITPVFCDIDPRSHNIDPAQVEKLITLERLALSVSTSGEGLAMSRRWRGSPKAWSRLGFRRGARVWLLPARNNGWQFRTRGSLQLPRDEVPESFEGGAVATNDDELASRIRLMKNFGFAGYDNVVYPGQPGR